MSLSTAPAAAGTTLGAVVQVRNATVRFGDRMALDGVDLRADPGEVVALLGHSGSGKSTLMKALTGLVDSSADELVVADHDLRAAGPAELRAVRAQVGHVFQQFNLVPQLSALTNVLTGGLHAAGWPNVFGVFGRTQRLRALALLDRVGILNRAGQRAHTLSGGEQQRVAIARALMQDPKLILADEPVASLDPRLAGSVLSLLREIAHERQIPVIVSLHVVALAKRYADRVVGLSGGRMVFDGLPTDLDQERVGMIYGPDTELADF